MWRPYSSGIQIRTIIPYFIILGEDDYPRKKIKVRGHVRLRSKIIFNFGHRMKALTVSANEGFVRAAFQQVIYFLLNDLYILSTYVEFENKNKKIMQVNH